MGYSRITTRELRRSAMGYSRITTQELLLSAMGYSRITTSEMLLSAMAYSRITTWDIQVDSSLQELPAIFGHIFVSDLSYNLFTL